ncbi:forkhead box transcription factor [Phanerochaete sordida]|uniref:Forkhead box transcription factor n=1 Tax=Phanerochaete sordida TaxID=48140 RepID=A0A9P3L8D9_9APHY|nr:forkhead box transcription factor [Phanerochaete sordida]
MAAVVAPPQDTPPTAATVLGDGQYANEEPVPDKISAYYSLVFPNFTYYLQTLNVTIGRRCIPANTASTSDVPQVDVDLGPLKSVSRLHARIEYDEDEERFVLVVVGRNGAWVDGVWSGSGSRVPLGDRSQIQIASRTFHFVLPPPPAPPEDSPSPSSHSSVEHRPRSPSVDITSLDVTSISPPSSIPPNSPPVSVSVSSPPKKALPLPEPQLPNSNSIARFKSNKKRKKSDADSLPRVKPDVMPPKPQYTYAQLCYRAIKALGGRASLQDICQWIQDSYEWYKYSDKDWESSVRHNLSSSRAFKKVERGPEEKGKGALWSVDPQYEHTFEEQEARKQAEAKGLGKKGKGAPLEPALKRSVKGDAKVPLPPPLTSAPLVMKTSFSHTMNTNHVPPPVPGTRAEPIATPAPLPAAHSTPSFLPLHPAQPAPGASPPAQPAATPASAQASSSIPPIPPSVRLPIVVGPVPASSPEASNAEPKPIVLHQNTLILNPTIFAHLTPQQLRDLEALGAQKALEILQGYIVRFYKEKLRAEGGRGRGRGRGRRPRGGGSQGPPRAQAPEGLFVTTPLPSRTPKPELQGTPSEAPPMGSLQPPPERAESPVIIIDDDDEEDAHVAKRPRLEGTLS